MTPHTERPEGDPPTAKQAREQAEAALVQVQAQWDEVHAVSNPLRIRLERNHFAEMFAKALQPREKRS